ncbi:unnamed protein product, partial [Owenia fusiformis]
KLAQTGNMLPPTDNRLAQTDNMLPPTDNRLAQTGNMLPPTDNRLPSTCNMLPPTGSLLPPEDQMLPPNGNTAPHTNNMMAPLEDQVPFRPRLIQGSSTNPIQGLTSLVNEWNQKHGPVGQAYSPMSQLRPCHEPHTIVTPQRHDTPHRNDTPHRHDMPYPHDIQQQHDTPQRHDISRLHGTLQRHDMPHLHGTPQRYDMPLRHALQHRHGTPQRHDTPHQHFTPQRHDTQHRHASVYHRNHCMINGRQYTSVETGVLDMALLRAETGYRCIQCVPCREYLTVHMFMHHTHDDMIMKHADAFSHTELLQYGGNRQQQGMYSRIERDTWNLFTVSLMSLTRTASERALVPYPIRVDAYDTFYCDKYFDILSKAYLDDDQQAADATRIQQNESSNSQPDAGTGEPGFTEYPGRGMTLRTTPSPLSVHIPPPSIGFGKEGPQTDVPKPSDLSGTLSPGPLTDPLPFTDINDSILNVQPIKPDSDNLIHSTNTSQLRTLLQTHKTRSLTIKQEKCLENDASPSVDDNKIKTQENVNPDNIQVLGQLSPIKCCGAPLSQPLKTEDLNDSPKPLYNNQTLNQDSSNTQIDSKAKSSVTPQNSLDNETNKTVNDIGGSIDEPSDGDSFIGMQPLVMDISETEINLDDSDINQNIPKVTLNDSLVSNPLVIDVDEPEIDLDNDFDKNQYDSKISNPQSAVMENSTNGDNGEMENSKNGDKDEMGNSTNKDKVENSSYKDKDNMIFDPVDSILKDTICDQDSLMTIDPVCNNVSTCRDKGDYNEHTKAAAPICSIDSVVSLSLDVNPKENHPKSSTPEKKNRTHDAYSDKVTHIADRLTSSIDNGTYGLQDNTHSPTDKTQDSEGMIAQNTITTGTVSCPITNQSLSNSIDNTSLGQVEENLGKLPTAISHSSENQGSQQVEPIISPTLGMQHEGENESSQYDESALELFISAQQNTEKIVRSMNTELEHCKAQLKLCQQQLVVERKRNRHLEQLLLKDGGLSRESS